jgi:hypothetical protein
MREPRGEEKDRDILQRCSSDDILRGVAGNTSVGNVRGLFLDGSDGAFAGHPRPSNKNGSGSHILLDIDTFGGGICMRCDAAGGIFAATSILFKICNRIVRYRRGAYPRRIFHTT